MDPLTRLQSDMRACRLCLEAGHQITPGAVFSGGRGARAMVIGQAPGSTEVEAGRPFNAGSGRRLFDWLGRAGWQEDGFRLKHYMTAVTKCYPGRSSNGRGDRVPSLGEQALCRPFLELELQLVDPLLIIPVGGLAIKRFFPAGRRLDQIIDRAVFLPDHTQGANKAAFSMEMAEELEDFDSSRPENGRWLVPLPHPSGASAWPNKPQNRALIEKAIGILADIRSHHGL